MKEGWKYKKLGEVCDKVSNLKWQNVPSNSVYSYVDLTAVDRDSFNITNTQSINRENAPSRAKQIIKQNDVLFGTTRPTLRRVCVVEDKNDDDICSTGFCVLRPKSEIVSSKWVFYQLMAEKYYAYIEPLQSGATYPAVTDAVVKSYIIPIPPLSEQQHIVEELDLLSSIIEKKKAQLNELDNLAQSLFYEMFGDPIINEKGWKVKKLGDISNYSKTRIKAEEVSIKNYVGVDNLLQKCKGKTDAAKVPEAINHIEYIKDDVLIGNIRPYLKKIWLAKYRGGCNGDVLVIRRLPLYQNTVNPIYLFKCLSDDVFFAYDMQFSKGEKMPKG